MASQADISSALQQSGVSVYGLQVQSAGGRTVVHGTVGTDAERQKAQQAIARVASDAQVELRIDSGFAATTKDARRTYTVKAGDSLSKIAQHHYGDASQWPKIYEANRGTIADPDLIHPGEELVIP